MESSRSITHDYNESGTANNSQSRTTAAQQILCTALRSPHEPRQRQSTTTLPNDANRGLAASTATHIDSPPSKCDRTQRYAKCIVANDIAANTITQRSNVQQTIPFNSRQQQQQQATKMSDVIVSGRKMRPTTSLVRASSRTNANQSHAYNMADASDTYSTKSGSSCGSTCTATSCSGSDS